MTFNYDTVCHCYYDSRNHDDSDSDSDLYESDLHESDLYESSDDFVEFIQPNLFCKNPLRCCAHNENGVKCSDFEFHVQFCCHYNDQIDPICDHWENCCTHGGPCCDSQNSQEIHVPNCCEFDEWASHESALAVTNDGHNMEVSSQ